MKTESSLSTGDHARIRPFETREDGMEKIPTATRQQRPAVYPTMFWFLVGLFTLIGLVVVSRYNYLLFHSLAELFSISVAWAVFFLVWNTRKIVNNDALVFVGIAYFFVGFIDMLHTLAYKGMGVYDARWGANLPTQLWILARYMESVALLLYPVLIGKTIRPIKAFAGWFVTTTSFLAAIFLRPIFPDCYIDGTGLTAFKIVSEYIICLLLGVAFVLLFQKRDQIDKTVFRLISLSIIVTIFAELAFTFYVSVYGLSNLVGHFFKIISFVLIYQALVRTGLTQPYSTLFRSVKESEEKYQALFHNAQVGLFRSRVSDGKPIEVNTLCAELAGYPSAHECIERFEDFENHLLRQACKEMLPDLNHTGVVKHIDRQFSRDDGASIWVSLSGSLSSDKKCIEGAIVDISERKRQEKIQTSLLRLINVAPERDVKTLLQLFLDEAEILTGSEIGFFHFVDPDQETVRLQTWSTHTVDRMCQAEGDGLHYAISKAGVWVDCIAERKPVIHNDYEHLPHKKGLPEGHAPVIRELVVPVIRSDTVVAILGVGNKPNPYDDDDVKSVQHLANTAWEIIERKRAEEKLQAAHDRLEQEVLVRTKAFEAIANEYESFFNSSQVGMMVLRGGRFFYKGNRRLADILGYETPEEMSGLSMKALHLDEAHFHDFGKKHYSRLRQGEVLHLEYELRRKDGKSIWCSLSGKALGADQPIDLDEGVLWIIDDISDRKQSEQRLRETLNELERSNKELAQFAYVASHDLQEPLRAIVGFLQLLKARYDDRLDEKGRHYIDRTVRASHRMQTLISDLLTLSRVNTRELTFEPADFNHIVHHALKRLQPHIDRKRAKINCAELPTLMADKRQMETIFHNLISNALKYNENQEPVIEIGGTRKDSEYRFHVKDNGIGIPSKFYDRIFTVFQRLHGRNEYSGTGIGLTLCKKIVEHHGGRIWVESNVGEGATFYFTLPLKRTV